MKMESRRSSETRFGSVSAPRGMSPVRLSHCFVHVQNLRFIGVHNGCMVLMVRVKIVWYWKRYMRKSRYRYKRYFLPLPKVLGDSLPDTKVEWVAQKFGPAIVYLPKGLESFLSRLEKLGNATQENTVRERSGPTDLLLED